MNQTITLSDLILFAYNETSLLKTVRVKKAVENEPSVRAAYRKLTSLLNALAQVPCMDPPEHVVNSIKAYSLQRV